MVYNYTIECYNLNYKGVIESFIISCNNGNSYPISKYSFVSKIDNHKINNQKYTIITSIGTDVHLCGFYFKTDPDDNTKNDLLDIKECTLEYRFKVFKNQR